MTEQVQLQAPEPTSAIIIPFPVRKPEAIVLEPAPEVPASSADRLSTSLVALSTALSDQQVAIQRWRQAMAELSACMQKLSGGLQRIETSKPHLV